MRKFLLLNLLLLLSIGAKAQLEVKKGSFKEVPGFVNINPDPNYQYDDNDKPFAVLKVLTENINEEQRARLLFQGDAQTFIMVENKVGEVWLYLSYYASYIKISHPDFSSTEYHFPFDMKPKCGYEITLINTAVQTNIGSGRLMITTKPENGATITMDGKVLSQKTPYTNDMIATGQHIVTVSKFGFEDVTKNILIENDLTTNLEIVMPYLYGSVKVDSEPNGATVIIDDNEVGVTPLILNTIRYGSHIIKIQKGQRQTYEAIITIVNDNLISINGVLADYPKDAINGVFSISESGKVVFSKGNLQYQKTTNTWRFAEHQWDKVGNANHKLLIKGNKGWIDLFGWGTGNDPNRCCEHENYGNFYDWGLVMPDEIKWRTLTQEEWQYLFEIRQTYSGIRFAKARINGVNGIILLPDDWNSNIYLLNSINNNEAGYQSNKLSLKIWEDKFEPNGAVFLPAAGIRSGQNTQIISYKCHTEVFGTGRVGYYWSASERLGGIASYCLEFNKGNIYTKSDCRNYVGLSVRLVFDVEN